MRFSEQWLREFVDPAVSTQELADQLTMAGLEVDAVEPVAPAFEGVLVGEVLEVEPHPDADKLRVCRVNVGEGEPLNIVCGASNVRVGLRVPTAIVGAKLPGDFKIKKAKLRGVPSFGMLCSAKELGLADISDGLMELPADSPVGRDLRDFLGLDDKIIELGLTPNRGDCLSIAGIAREVGVLNRSSVHLPDEREVTAVVDTTFSVSLEAPSDCPRYVGRVIEGVDNNARTPMWMQERLRRSGVRSLGPVVDVTNYILLELGQPMHAFDLAKLSGGIVVRKAREGEKLTLLNDEEVTLSPENLVIADDQGSLALAGIMGGRDSAVSAETRDIFLESAFFTPTSIAGHARSFGLHTDSSHRFERGVSFDLQRRAIERATELLLAIVGGRPGPVVEKCETAALPPRQPILLRQARIGKILGSDIEASRIGDILTRLGMNVETLDGQWQVTPPPFRFDVAIEEDLIEEVGRIYGYARLPSTLPLAPMEMRAAPEIVVGVNRLRSLLIDRGYQEAITYSFVDPKMQELLDPGTVPVSLRNPISADLSVMRTTLWPGLLQALLHNVNRQQGRVRLFETGLRFVPRGDETVQERVVSGLAYGDVYPEQWESPARKVDFFDVKGDIESLVGLTGRSHGLIFSKEQHSVLHPGQSAHVSLDGEPLGWIGALHPTVEKKLGLPGRVYLFELKLAVLEQGRLPKFGELSRFPAIRRDIAIIVNAKTEASDILKCVRSAAPDTLQDLKLFDVYAGEHIDSGGKSVALGLTFQAQSRTLTDEDVDNAIGKILDTLGAELDAKLRD